MDTVRLRFIGPDTRTVPTLGREVEPDTLVEFPGKVLTEAPEGEVWLDDAIHIESGNPPQVRAWPTSLWRNETTAVRASAAKASKE